MMKAFWKNEVSVRAFVTFVLVATVFFPNSVLGIQIPPPPQSGRNEVQKAREDLLFAQNLLRDSKTQIEIGQLEKVRSWRRVERARGLGNIVSPVKVRQALYFYERASLGVRAREEVAEQAELQRKLASARLAKLLAPPEKRLFWARQVAELEIDSHRPALRAQQIQIEIADSHYKFQETEFERIDSLHRSEIIGARPLLEATFEREVARLELKSAQKRFEILQGQLNLDLLIQDHLLEESPDSLDWAVDITEAEVKLLELRVEMRKTLVQSAAQKVALTNAMSQSTFELVDKKIVGGPRLEDADTDKQVAESELKGASGKLENAQQALGDARERLTSLKQKLGAKS